MFHFKNQHFTTSSLKMLAGTFSSLKSENHVLWKLAAVKKLSKNVLSALKTNFIKCPLDWKFLLGKSWQIKITSEKLLKIENWAEFF